MKKEPMSSLTPLPVLGRDEVIETLKQKTKFFVQKLREDHEHAIQVLDRKNDFLVQENLHMKNELQVLQLKLNDKDEIDEDTNNLRDNESELSKNRLSILENEKRNLEEILHNTKVERDGMNTLLNEKHVIIDNKEKQLKDEELKAREIKKKMKVFLENFSLERKKMESEKNVLELSLREKNEIIFDLNKQVTFLMY